MSQKNYYTNVNDEIIHETNTLTDDENNFMLMPNINEHKNSVDKELCLLSTLIGDAINRAENNDKVEENIENPINNIVENFDCNTKCIKNNNEKFFDREETKYLLFIIALLFLCGILFRN